MPTTTESTSNASIAHGKFLSRAGHKFFFKAMRLPDVSATLDFGQKLKVRKRLDDLKAAHTTGLVLSEAQAQPLLDLAAQSGLVAMLELSITPEELLRTRGWKAVVSRIAHTAHVFSKHPALIGYILDCPVTQDQLRAAGLENARRRLRSIISIIKGSRARRRSSESRCVRRRVHFRYWKKIFSTVKSQRSSRLKFVTS